MGLFPVAHAHLENVKGRYGFVGYCALRPFLSVIFPPCSWGDPGPNPVTSLKEWLYPLELTLTFSFPISLPQVTG